MTSKQKKKQLFALNYLYRTRSIWIVTRVYIHMPFTHSAYSFIVALYSLILRSTAAAPDQACTLIFLRLCIIISPCSFHIPRCWWLFTIQYILNSVSIYTCLYRCVTTEWNMFALTRMRALWRFNVNQQIKSHFNEKYYTLLMSVYVVLYLPFKIQTWILYAAQVYSIIFINSNTTR